MKSSRYCSCLYLCLIGKSSFITNFILFVRFIIYVINFVDFRQASVSFISLSRVPLSAPAPLSVAIRFCWESLARQDFHSGNDNKKVALSFVKVSGNVEVVRCNSVAHFPSYVKFIPLWGIFRTSGCYTVLPVFCLWMHTMLLSETRIYLNKYNYISLFLRFFYRKKYSTL
jgi:hypothetical protein